MCGWCICQVFSFATLNVSEITNIFTSNIVSFKPSPTFSSCHPFFVPSFSYTMALLVPLLSSLDLVHQSLRLAILVLASEITVFPFWMTSFAGKIKLKIVSMTCFHRLNQYFILMKPHKRVFGCIMWYDDCLRRWDIAANSPLAVYFNDLLVKW